MCGLPWISRWPQTDLAERNEVLNKRLAAMEEEVLSLKRSVRLTSVEGGKHSSEAG
jgi:hypothetical protein